MTHNNQTVKPADPILRCGLAFIVVLIIVAAALGVWAYSGHQSSSTTPKPATAVGALEIVTYPPNVNVYVNGELCGRSQPQEATPFRSKPLLVENVPAGTCEIIAEREGTEPAVKTVAVLAGNLKKVDLISWRPDTTIELVDGHRLNGMIVALTDEYLDLAVKPNSIRRIASVDVARRHRKLVPKMINRPEMKPNLDKKTGELEYVFDPFPNEDAPDK